MIIIVGKYFKDSSEIHYYINFIALQELVDKFIEVLEKI